MNKLFPQIPQKKESSDWSSWGLQCSPQSSMPFSVSGKWTGLSVTTLCCKVCLRCSACLLCTPSSGAPSPQTMTGSTRPCACSAGPCCALRAPAASASWMERMWGPAPPTLLPVEPEWACSSGGSTEGLLRIKIFCFSSKTGFVSAFLKWIACFPAWNVLNMNSDLMLTG